MTNIFLYPGETTSPSDIKLRDPTGVAFSTKIAVPVIELSAAPTGRTTYYQSLFQPIYIPPVVATTPQGWQQALSTAPAVAQAVNVSYDLPSVLAQTPQGWQQALSTAPAVTRVQADFGFVPYNTAQVSVNFTNFGWQSQPPIAPPVAKAQVGFGSSAQVVVAPYTNFYFAPLSVPLPVARAIQSDPFVPFNTVQPVVVYPTGIPLNAGDAPPRKRQVYYQTRLDPPSPVTQVVVSVPYGWWTPLSTVPPTAKAQVGFGSVPFNTAQLAVNYTTFGWSSPLSGAPAVAKAKLSDWSLPYNVVNVVTTAWQSQLSVAPATTTAVHDFGSLPSSVPQQLAIAWAAPLSVAPTVAKAQAGFATVPFYPATQVAGIAGMAWFTPLWSVPMRNFVAQQGDSFVPFNTTQQIVITTPGRRRPILFIANVGRLMN